MSDEKLLESFICLIRKLDFVNENTEACKKLGRVYRPLFESDNVGKKSDVAEKIRIGLKTLYEKHREDIICKDFSFIQPASSSTNQDGSSVYAVNSDTFIVDNFDIGILYLNAIDADIPEALRSVNTELLYLFYQIATEEDQKVIASKYMKKGDGGDDTNQKGTTTGSSKGGKGIPNIPITAAPNLAKKMEKMLQKHKGKLKKAEHDPNAIPEVLADFFQNNSKDMAGMLTGMLSTMGIDPAQMGNNNK